MPSTITTIFFDIGNVLMGFEYARIWQCFATASPYVADDIRQRIQSQDLLFRHEIGDISSEDLYQQVRNLLDLDSSVSFGQFCRFWGEIFWPQDAVIRLAEALIQQYQVILLSNTNDIHWNYLIQEFPFFNRVDDAVLSFRVNAMKPDPKIYAEALQRANAPADQCVFIDDIFVNIQAAEALGIHGIQCRSAEQVEQELRHLGVRWNGQADG